MGCGASSKPDVSQPLIGTEDSTASLQAVEEPVRQNRNSCVENEIIPEYWYNKRAKGQGLFDDMYYVQDNEHSKFDELFAATYVGRCTQDRPCPKSQHDRTPGGCPCVQPGADPGLPIGFRVLRVIRVEASSMWAKYQAKFDGIKSKRGGSASGQFSPPLVTQAVASKHKGIFAPLNSEMNEVYTFHGTFVRYALSIAQNDFNIDLAGSSRGTLYGRGAYLAESITKADEYAKDEPSGYYAGVFSVLVCRVCMGKLYTTSDDQGAADKIKGGEFDSTCGQRLFRELVIYDADQLYPEYIVLYKRVYQKDSEAYIASMLKRRFFMEVPLHWRNNARSLQDGFKEQHRGLPGINEFFQSLVTVSLACESHNVVLSSRVENSELWNRYTDFKSVLRDRLGGHEGRHADSSSSLGQVEKEIREMTKWPCKFFSKGSCKNGERCRYSHSPASASLSNVALSAGRRLPLGEIDNQLNEHFLWYPGSKRQSVSMSKGNFNRQDFSESFFESLIDALGHVQSDQGTKYALLCRVVCGTPGDVPSSPKPGSMPSYARSTSDCSILLSGSMPGVTIWNPSQVYPEFIVELHSPEDQQRENGLAMSEEDQAAITIQCMARVFFACRRVKAMRERREKQLAEQWRSTIKKGLHGQPEKLISGATIDSEMEVPLPGLSGHLASDATLA